MERTGQAMLVLVDTGVNEIEAMYIKYRLEEAGYRVFVAGPKMGEKCVGRYGYPCPTEATYHDVQARHFAGVICPGGWAPARLRTEGKVTMVVNDFFQSGKLVAAICHGGSVLISAGICNGLKMTGSPAILDDLRNAGAELMEGPVVIDG
ncbi:MAG TPA: DJ-1/PfpI family protein, partial [Terriglobales bacterium]